MTCPPGHARGGGVVGAARLVDQRGEHGGQTRRVEAVPQTRAQRLGGEQVHLVVDPHQGAAAVGDPRRAVVVLEVAECGEHVADPVELPGDGVGALLDPALQRLRVAVELEVALGPAGVVLAVGAAVARVRAQLPSQLLDPVVLLGSASPSVCPVLPLARGRRGQVVRPVAQGRGEVAPRLRVAAVEVARDLHPGDRADRGREVDQAQPSGVPVGGEHVGARAVAVGAGAGVDDDRHAGEAAAGHLDHVTGAQRLERVDDLLASVGPS